MRIGTAVALWRALARSYAAVPRLLGAGYALPPLRVAILLTHRCNLRCTMCVVPGANSPPGGELSPGDIRHVLDQVSSRAVVTLTGGEPLLRRDLLEIVRTSATTHRLHLVTNGTLLDTEWARLLVGFAPKRLRGRGLINLGVSVHGVGAVHDAIVGVPGSYDKAMAAVREVTARRRGRFPLVDVKVVMTKDNVGHLVELYHEARRAGADMCSFQIQSNQTSSYGVPHSDTSVHLRCPPAITGVDVQVLDEEIRGMRGLAKHGTPLVRFSPHIGGDRVLDHYRNAVNLQRFICYSTWSTLHVAPTGEVYPCFSYPMGNVKADPLMDIWNGPPYRQFRRELRKRGVFPGCVGCCVIDERAMQRGRDS